MRENPNLDQLKRQAKELLEAYRASSPEAVAEVTLYLPTATPANFALHDAQFVLARAYGFETWRKLKAAVEDVTPEKLHQAVESGDLVRARELLLHMPRIVNASHGGLSPLHIAVMRRDLGMTELLLEFGANPEAGVWPDPYATSPGIMARERGYEEISNAMEAELEKRAPQRPKPTDAMRKFHEAFGLGGEEAAVGVLDRYPELAETMGADGVTMLHQAAGVGAALFVKWLLEHGKDPNGRVQFGLFQAATFLPKSEEGWAPLDFASVGWCGEWLFDKQKFERVAKVLLDYGAELTPLSAATLGRWEYLETLPRPELEGKGVLEAAVKGDQLDTVRRLLDLGFDPNEHIEVGHMENPAPSSGGPLFQAIVLNHVKIARLLLERGADPNASVFTAGSGASKAFNARDPELIALVERYGGRLDADSAGWSRQPEIARKMLGGEIEAHVAPSDSPKRAVAERLIEGAASVHSVEIVRMALEHIDWPQEDSRWFGLLLRPVCRVEDWTDQQKLEALECFKVILARSGGNRVDEHGQSVLHYLVAEARSLGVEMATMCLDAGARLDVRDELLKSTPLGWACRWGRVELVKLFLARGADPVEVDAEVWARPRAWAEKMRRSEIVDLLGLTG
jgi:ankyrin repeat protein